MGVYVPAAFLLCTGKLADCCFSRSLGANGFWLLHYTRTVAFVLSALEQLYVKGKR
jgi:hypothetical protein